MKISKYTFLVNDQNREFYIYNSLSNALVELDENSYGLLSKTQNSHSEISRSDFDSELWEVLETKKFITENDIDDYLFYKSVITQQRANVSSMHLTVAPTMNCCFSCHYCFEKYKEPGKMSPEVMDSLIKYLNSLDSKPDITVTWFGGEPLMAIEQIEQLYDKLVAYYKKPKHSDIITTGFHIDKRMIDVFKRIGITQIQVTLDGLKDTHNKVKQTEDCDDVFSKVLDNIELVMIHAPEINVVIRVNITKINAGEYVPLYKQLVDRYKHYRNFGISPGIVMERGACNKESTKKAILFNPKESAQFNLDLYHTHHIYTSFMRYPSRFFQECGIRNTLSMAFDPAGYAYKCWELIGNKEYSIGKLSVDGKIEMINICNYNRQMYGADPLEDSACTKCKYLPLCNGGCPIQRIENKFEGKQNCTCTYYKGYMADFLKIHIAEKKLKTHK